METLAANVGRVQRRTVHGREFLVAPITILRPGVLNGSKGALYYPPDEIARDHESWNGIPILINHSTRDGASVSGRSPDVVERQGVGHVYSSRITKDGRQVVDGWFDADALRRVSVDVYNRLLNGQPVSVSTGLFTSNEKSEGKDGKGRSYSFVARAYKPDHLAVLPDQAGACSIEDGCGVLLNKSGARPEIVDAVDLSSLRVGDGVLVGDELKWSVTRSRHADNAFCPTGSGGGVDPSCGKDGGGSPAEGSGGKDASGPVPMHSIKVPKSGKMSIDQAHDAMKQMGYTPVGSFAESTRLDPKLGPVTKYKTPNGKIVELSHQQVKDAVMTGARNYDKIPRDTADKRAAGKPLEKSEATKSLEQAAARRSDASKSLDESKQRLAALKSQLAAVKARQKAERQVKNQLSNEGGRKMPLTTEEKGRIVGDLIANCGECGWDEEDRETLNAFGDEKLARMDAHRKASIRNAELVANAEKALADGDAEEVCNEDDQECLDRLAAKKEKGKTPWTQAQNADEWLARAPEEVWNAVRESMEIVDRERQGLIESLTANLAGKDKAAVADVMKGKGLPELRTLQALAPAKRPTVNYAGSAGTMTRNAPAKIAPLRSPDSYAEATN